MHLQFEFTTTPEQIGLRLDQLLAQLYPDYSRARWQSWIKTAAVLVNQQPSVGKFKLQGKERITVDATLAEQVDNEAQAIALNIVYEDSELIIINKPAGMVVHPAVGNRHSTLLNALLHYAPELTQVPRAGIVHRLDKDTSGLLMIARTLSSHTYLVRQLQARAIHREYTALAQGKIIAGNTIDIAIGRHPTQRTKMAVVNNGREAITHYRVVERFPHYTLVHVQLETGRTHQIRVHFAHIKHPLVGDPVYGGRLQMPKHAGPGLQTLLHAFKRQALHANCLEFEHPKTKEPMKFFAPLPADFVNLIEMVRKEDKVN